MNVHTQVNGADLAFDIPSAAQIPGVVRELMPLFKAHWDEVGGDNVVARPLDVDEAFYDQMARGGRMLAVIARRGSEAVGYVVYFIRTHPHHRTWKIAVSDVLYVVPEWRYPGVISGLFRAAEAQLGGLGVNSIYHTSKVHLDLTPLFLRLGYKAQETVYEKVL